MITINSLLFTCEHPKTIITRDNRKMVVSCGTSTISSLFYGETSVESVKKGLKSSASTGVFSLLGAFGGSFISTTPSVKSTYELQFLFRYISFFRNFI